MAKTQTKQNAAPAPKKSGSLAERMGFVKAPKTTLVGERLTPPDIGFRVYQVADAVDPNDHDALLWQALTELNEMLSLKILAVPRVNTNPQKGTHARKEVLATVYYCGESIPRRKYIACFSPTLSQEFAVQLLSNQPQILILRACAVTEEIRLVLALVHGGLKNSVSIYTHCPPKCPTCGAA